MHETISKSVAAPTSEKRIAAVAVLGTSTSMGKSTISDVTASFFRAAGVAVHTVRVESGRRRAEFPAGDSFVDLDRVEDAVHAVGGVASLFDEPWRRIKDAMTGRHVVVIDCGAGGQDVLLDVAGSTGLADVMAAGGTCLSNLILVTPDAESTRQAARLVAEVRERMPAAGILLAVNHLNPGQRPGLDTPQARAVSAILKPLGVARIDIPFCGAQALAAFADSRRSILEILRADEAQLVRWTRKGELASLAAQAHLAAWWRAIIDQFGTVWPFAAPNR